MKVRVDEIPPEGLVLDLKEDGNRLFEPAPGPRFDEKIVSHLALHPVGQSVTLSGETRTCLVLQCSRCLEDFRFGVRSEITLEIRSISEISDGGEIELSADEMDVEYYTGGAIDLNEIVMGQIAEEVPLKPLCREDCQGLCPVCGRNRNQGGCDCVTRTGDPRFAKLKDLLNSEDAGSEES